jgi:hypothetical protein
MKQLRLLAKRNRRTLSGEAQMALENHVAAHGLGAHGDRPDSGGDGAAPHETQERPE